MSMPALIAVVDDDPRILQSIEILLESDGYSVRLFTSAAALLETPSLGEIDCVISDINMPLIDGIELARLLRISRPRLPIVLITGHPELLSRSRSPIHYPLFTKPFNPNDLLATIKDVLRNTRRH